MPMTHIYNLTVSSVSASKMATTLATLPAKYTTTEYGTTICDFNGQESGSSRVCFYMMDAKKADALRKWFDRRFRGRAKFARLVTQRVKVESIPTAPSDTAPTPTTTDIG